MTRHLPTEFVFAPPKTNALAVANSSAVFPVGRVFCIGRNYRWQADEGERPQEMPPWFMKPPNAVVPATGAVPYPPQTQDFCHEIELVVGIGRGGSHIAPQDVEPQHIWGYAAGLDMTRRDLQQLAKRMGGPWDAAKAFDHSAPCTPLVPASVCGHPRQGAIWLAVNGVDRQRGDLSQLLWSVPELVAMLSRSLELQPGDLIFTGTPAGVGPLQMGDELSGGIAGVGQFTLSISTL
jgi:fumarylpyruvate hydrolase